MTRNRSTVAVMIFEPEESGHWCLDDLAAICGERPPWLGPIAGSVARCTCGRFYVIDERSGLWKRLPRWSRRVREALAHHDERRQR